MSHWNVTVYAWNVLQQRANQHDVPWSWMQAVLIGGARIPRASVGREGGDIRPNVQEHPAPSQGSGMFPRYIGEGCVSNRECQC